MLSNSSISVLAFANKIVKVQPQSCKVCSFFVGSIKDVTI